ncbi:MAG: hypothetical protein Q4B28_07680 [bacterium]|nr:hypothetical protein [bacterium]
MAGTLLLLVLMVTQPVNAQNASNPNSTTEQVELQKNNDYIELAKAKLLQYYNSEDKQHFEHIFHIIFNTPQHIQDVANHYLHKHGKQFDNEKDHITFILMTLELLNSETKFTEKYEQQDDLDRRVIAANDVVKDMTKHFK